MLKGIFVENRVVPNSIDVDLDILWLTRKIDDKVNPETAGPDVVRTLSDLDLSGK